jgi:pilus assembly protein Flp/PilA
VFRKFLREEAAATAVEYGLIMALISLALMGAVTLLGEQLNTTFDSGGGGRSGLTAR